MNDPDIIFINPAKREASRPIVEHTVVVDVTAEMRGLGFQSGDAMLIKLLTEADTQFGIPKDKSKSKLRVRLKYADDCGIPEDHRDQKFLMKAVVNNKVLGEFTMDDLLRNDVGELVHPPHDLHWSLVEWVFLAPRELFDSDIQRTGVGKTGKTLGESRRYLTFAHKEQSSPPSRRAAA
jgi:hypothetical protein